MSHPLDNNSEERLLDETAIGRLLDKLLYDRLLARMTPSWVDDIITKDMKDRVERVAAMVMGKLLTRNYSDVDNYIATRIAERITKKDFKSMVERSVTAMLKTHGPELEKAAHAAVQEAITQVIDKQFKTTLRERAAVNVRERAEAFLSAATLVPEDEKTDFARDED